MAHIGLDHDFGLQGCSSHVDGFGGTPLGIVVDNDGRPAIVCAAPSQRSADRATSPAGRFRAPPVTTVRVVSFPRSGRPEGTSSERLATSADAVDEDFMPSRAVTHPARIAVLGTASQAGRVSPAVLVYRPARRVNQVAEWALSQRIDLARGTDPSRCGIGWDTGSDGPVVVAASLRGRTPKRGRASWSIELLVQGDPIQWRPQRVQIPMGGGVDIPSGYTATVRVGTVLVPADGRLLITLSIDALDPASGSFRLLGAVDAGRAMVVGLIPRPGGGWDPDLGFGRGGVWLTSRSDGDVTAAELGALSPDGTIVVAGRARRGGTDTVYLAALDSGSGALVWSTDAGSSLSRVAALAVDQQGRVVLAGGTRPFIIAAGEAVVMRFSGFGAVDAGYGVGGAARFRLHGGTQPLALTATPTGECFIASAVRWGRFGAAVTYHPCVSKLTSTGALDPLFGQPGTCRHDGLGEVTSIAIGPTGSVWWAGVRRVFVRMTTPPLGQTSRMELNWTLTIGRTTTAGELDLSFGTGGLRAFSMRTLVVLTDADAHDVASIVPLSDGRAVVSGVYSRTKILPDGSVDFEARGAWLVRLLGDGALDPAFGVGGVRIHPAAAINLIAELADGSLQGFEDSSTLRLNADGQPAPGFGTNGRQPTVGGPTRPRTVEADGSWFALKENGFSGVGLVWYGPDGTIQPAFGAGDQNAAASRFTDASTIAPLGRGNIRWNSLDRSQTIRLADGTYLTVWSVIADRSGRRDATDVVLLAWNADGTPRPLQPWGNLSARLIVDPVTRIGGQDWLNWTPRAAVLQPDGSIVVGVAADDDIEAASFPGPAAPRRLPSRAYFCRLVPPAFDHDTGFGVNGIVKCRYPDDGYTGPGALRDVQAPVALSVVGPAVLGAVQCIAVDGTKFGQGFLDPVKSPDLPFDGSIGIVRLA